VAAGITVLFGWMALVGVVRAEFLRTRNFDYIRAAQALGVSDRGIIFRHMLPNAVVATLTFLPFILCSSITTLTSLDFLGFGLPLGSPSLGELLLQEKTTCRPLAWHHRLSLCGCAAFAADFYWRSRARCF
jgi:microcin C transport system permease protein